MLIRTILICLALAPLMAQAKQLSQTFKTNHSDLKVIKGYESLSNKGIISLKTCNSCEEKQFILTNKTILAENGLLQPIDDLLKIKLSNKPDHILVQVNKFDQSVFYIEWGYPEGEEEGQE